jgi:cell division protein FtsI/penicillin-binding protein 2
MATYHNQQLRVALLFIFFCTCYVAIIANLFLLQIYQHSFFADLAEKQYQMQITKIPGRALITDRNHKPLACNRYALSASICPYQIEDESPLSLFLQTYFPQAYQHYVQHKQSHFMFIQRNLTDHQKDLITDAHIPEIQLLKEPHRYYPISCLGSIVGITNIDNEGSLGIEYLYNDQLKGTNSYFSLQKDARLGLFYFDKRIVEDGTDGKPVQLTIDADLQFLVHELLAKTVTEYQAKQGSVIIMNPDNGDILTMANYPTFNPNIIQHLELSLTKNYCIAEQYEVGSVMKVFAALAALEEGVVTPDEQIDCRNVTTTFIDGRKVNTCTAHGMLTFTQVVAKSNNIGTALVAKRLEERLYDHYCRLGFGKKTGIGLPGEQQGFVNPPAKWSAQSVISLSYGYEVAVTLLQLAQAFAMISSDGYMVKPRIVMDNETVRSLSPLYKKETIDEIKKILQETTLQGTAYRARMRGYRVMCKTGTANLLQNGLYIDNKNSYSCAGIIEKNDYKRVIVVYIKEADRAHLYASQVAVPLFEKIAQKVIIHDKIM